MSLNHPCPCGSKVKYKKCCKLFHDGKKAKNPLELMKSRYSAYAVKNSLYIIKTTHHANKDFMDDKKEWKASIDSFCKQTHFQSLNILHVDESQSKVTFQAKLIQDGKDVSFCECSTFCFEDGAWFYLSGEFIEL